MTVYHGGTEIVKYPKIIKTYTGRDFGSGFYTTDIQDQAIKWAKRQARYRNKPEAILNAYALDENVFQQLKILKFDKYSLDWLDFVVSCRKDAGFVHDYDIIIGKIANDDVGETIQAVVDGLTPKDYALSKLSFMQANNQICFSTDYSLRYIKFIFAERVY